MARAGITYFDVCKAAQALVARGDNPTVDAVRIALGNTGSKGTIAPLLKRWRAEHQELALAQASGLPDELLQAVRSLYERVSTEAEQQYQTAYTALSERERAWQERIDQQQVASATITKERDETLARLQALESERADWQARHQTLSVEHATAVTVAAGMKELLAELRREVGDLHHQLEMARRQFEHFQEAVAGQRAEERADAMLRVAERDLAVEELREELRQARTSLAQSEEARTTAEIQCQHLVAQLDDKGGQLVQLAEQETAREVAWRTEWLELSRRTETVTVQLARVQQANVASEARCMELTAELARLREPTSRIPPEVVTSISEAS